MSNNTRRTLFGLALPEGQLTPKSMLRWGIPIFCLALLILAIVMRDKTDGVESGNNQQSVLGVKTITAELVDSFETKRTYTGVVQPRRASELGFERTGRVEKIMFDAGEKIPVNRDIAILDTESLDAKLVEVRAQRDAADAILKELVAGPRAEVIAATKANIKDLSAQLGLAKANFSRVEKLTSSNAISQQEYDAAKFNVESSQARLSSAQSNLDELEAGTRLEKLAAQKANVAQLDASIESLQVEIRKSTLKAPFNAQIAMRYVDEGAIVSPGVTVFRILEDDALEAWIGLPPATIANMDQSAEFYLFGPGRKKKKIKATLNTVVPELDAVTRTQTAIFGIPKDSGLVAGQVIRIEVSESIDAKGFYLPTKALTRGQRGLWSIYVIQKKEEEQIAVRRDVEVLHTDSEHVLVRGTISSGEQIIVDGTHRITSGQRVHVVSGTEAGDK